ncbi:efflux RND transporter periplasmic adaptor subunit [Rhodopseudomonas boonkerdii]|uniref:efflux RND transporter periplasmic adaptor subunit n=1 Tax=Rhodopseudomonas boonkerdii TaxID=475937 RepID=UPI001E5CC3BB|nr:efflux RND transporter periplasmic adaptor subunit [Rhodopseudomonas boonkerdii]
MFAAGVGVASLGPRLFGGAGKEKAPVAQQEQKPASTEAKVDLAMDAERMQLAQIELAPARAGMVAKRLVVPGVIVPDADRVARVTVKLAGTVSELRKNIGDEVAKGEVLGAIESREVAEARSEYLASKLSDDLQQDLTGRDKGLFEGRAIPEQQYIKSRSAAAQSHMRFDIARQKLLALGLEESEIASIAAAPEGTLRVQYVRAPISGRVVERKVELGAAVGRDSQSTEMFTMVDLANVWVEMTVSSADIIDVREGQSVRITVAGSAQTGTAKVIFVNPLLDKETRGARVVAVLENPKRAWRPGAFVTAAIAVEEKQASVVVPISAIQNISGRKALFVRVKDGFQKRDVVVGQRDGDVVEIVSGLSAGERIASSNTFALKAELAKPTDED